MNRLLILISTVSLTLILASCKKELVGTKSIDKSRFKVADIDFDYFNGRTKVKYREGDKRINGTAHIRIKKDSIIWISVSPSVGIEVTRFMITPDTVLILNRLDKVFYKLGFEEISKYFSFNVNFTMIQGILLGNLTSPINEETDIQKEGDFYFIRQDGGALDIQSYVNAKTMKVETVLINEKSTNNFLTLKYSEFGNLSKALFPFNCLINLTYKSKKGPLVTSITLKYAKAEIPDKPLKFPFNIPKKYEAFNK